MSPLPPALAPLVWMLGTWHGKTEETWLLVGDRLVGVGFTPAKPRTTFEILLVDAPEGRRRLVAEVGPGPSTVFPSVEIDNGIIRFEEPAHDFPQWVEYVRLDDRHNGASIGKVGEPAAMSWRWRSRPTRVAPALEDADRAFAADVAARGVDAWLAWFDPEGVMWAEGAIPAGPEMRAMMEPALAPPGLQWSPTASAYAPRGDLGFTVGDWISGEEAGHYLTIWKRQPGGSWRVLWDQRI